MQSRERSRLSALVDDLDQREIRELDQFGLGKLNGQNFRGESQQWFAALRVDLHGPWLSDGSPSLHCLLSGGVEDRLNLTCVAVSCVRQAHLVVSSYLLHSSIRFDACILSLLHFRFFPILLCFETVLDRTALVHAHISLRPIILASQVYLRGRGSLQAAAPRRIIPETPWPSYWRSRLPIWGCA